MISSTADYLVRAAARGCGRARRFLEDPKFGDNIEDFLGVKKHRYGLAELEDQIGVVTGLAYTSVGGELLQNEALRLPGKGRMKTTGKLGDVMKESIDAASSYVRSISPKIGVKPPKFDTLDIHVHVPEGATPKDGPSAGVAMVTSIVSVLTEIPVKRLSLIHI